MTPDALHPLLPAMAARAAALDQAAVFPTEDVAALVGTGFARAPLPASLGGTGLGTRPDDAGAIAGVLRLLGGANSTPGRLFEAHVNALRLILRVDTPAQVAACAVDRGAGHLFGLWAADGTMPLRRSGGRLSGAKGPCSGAGHFRQALVTVTVGGAASLAILHLQGTEPVDASAPGCWACVPA